jgi:hypothetical protein
MDCNVLLHILSFVDDVDTAISLLKVGGKRCFDAAYHMGYIQIIDVKDKALKVGVQFKNQQIATKAIRLIMRKFNIRRRFDCCCCECCKEAEQMYCVPTIFTKPKQEWSDTSHWIFFMTHENAAFLDGLLAIWQMYLSTFNVSKISNVSLCDPDLVHKKAKIILGNFLIRKQNVLVPLNTPYTLMHLCRHL